MLGDSGIGHLALRAQPAGVDIVPIDYLMTNRQLFLRFWLHFRSGSGSMMEDLVLHPHVAVQVDQVHDGRWFSVVLKGKAERLESVADIEHSGILELVPTQPGDKLNYVRVIPDAITGRTFIACSDSTTGASATT